MKIINEIHKIITFILVIQVIFLIYAVFQLQDLLGSTIEVDRGIIDIVKSHQEIIDKYESK